jgi:hypothetical protein
MSSFGVGHRFRIDGTSFPWDFCLGEGQGWREPKQKEAGFSEKTRNELAPGQHLLVPARLPAMLELLWTKAKVRHVSEPKDRYTSRIPLLETEDLADEHEPWQRLLDAKAPIDIPPQSRRRVLLDLTDYLCCYPELVVRGGSGARIRIHFQEALYEDLASWSKGHRDNIAGNYFTMGIAGRDGLGDSWTLPSTSDGADMRATTRGPSATPLSQQDGAPKRLDTLWWLAGRYVELLVETADEPLTIESLVFYETGYPLEASNALRQIAVSTPVERPSGTQNDSRLTSSDQYGALLQELTEICLRTVQRCAHETYMDCPFYEQLQYIGDARIQALLTYICSSDSRLPRRAIELAAWSQMSNGFLQARAPSRIRLCIPTFSLAWIAMLHDYAFWRGDRAFVADMLPFARRILEAFWRSADPGSGADVYPTRHLGPASLRARGFIVSPQGWNFVDWVPDWGWGEPPGAEAGQISPCINWMVVWATGLAAELEEYAGYPEFAQLWTRLGREHTHRLLEAFWDPDTSLIAEDSTRSVFLEHTNSLALLTNWLPPEIAAALRSALFAKDAPTVRTTVYFSHYFFEAAARSRRPDVFFDRLEPWYEMVEMGLKTTYEFRDVRTTRSDCHAWSAHPLYHLCCSVAGIRPAAPAFAAVDFDPQLGPLERIAIRIPHPGGEIEAEIRRASNGQTQAKLVLPEEVDIQVARSRDAAGVEDAPELKVVRSAPTAR